jgi:hypothetical protein
MKRYLPFIPVLLLILGGCSTTDKKQDPVVPITPEITIQNITYPTFTNSTWTNVVGGSVIIQIDNTDAGGGVLSTTKDSTDVTNIVSYDKIVKKGTYNITLTSKSQSAVADTFIRFNAQLKGYNVDSKQAVSFTATTNDGLITISQGFIQANMTPIFKAQADGKEFKMGIKNGFYYLYVQNGVKGDIIFKEATTGQSVSKTLTIAALNQNNVVVTTLSGTLQVVFAPFNYVNVSAETNTLINVNVVQGDYYYFGHNNGVYFVATDENGVIIGQAKYVDGTTKFKLVSTAPYAGSRLNLFIIIIPIDGLKPSITGYLQVRKGSTYNSRYSVLPSQSESYIKPYLKNGSSFDRLIVSTNVHAVIPSSPSDTLNFQPDVFIANGEKLYVQLLKNNEYTYNFFDVPLGTVGINVDVSKVTKTPEEKTVSGPVSDIVLQLYAKNDIAHFDSYLLDLQQTHTGSLTLRYPKEAFKEYELYSYYLKSGFEYYAVLTGPSIPEKVPTFDATFNVSGTSLDNFVPSFSGSFDYYHAAFENTAGTDLRVDLYSPSAGNYTNVKLPSFGKFLGVTGLRLADQKLLIFELVQYQGFNEKVFSYKPAGAIRSAADFNAKAVRKAY